MSISTRTFTFTDGTTAFGSQVETEISNLSNLFNNIDSGAQPLASLKVTGDITNTGLGKGIVVTTPDGTHTYRLAIDNNGAITSEQVS